MDENFLLSLSILTDNTKVIQSDVLKVQDDIITLKEELNNLQINGISVSGDTDTSAVQNSEPVSSTTSFSFQGALNDDNKLLKYNHSTRSYNFSSVTDDDSAVTIGKTLRVNSGELSNTFQVLTDGTMSTSNVICGELTIPNSTPGNPNTPGTPFRCFGGSSFGPSFGINSSSPEKLLINNVIGLGPIMDDTISDDTRYGTIGQVLTSQGNSNIPIWSTPSTGVIDDVWTYLLPQGNTRVMTAADTPISNFTIGSTSGNVELSNGAVFVAPRDGTYELNMQLKIVDAILTAADQNYVLNINTRDSAQQIVSTKTYTFEGTGTSGGYIIHNDVFNLTRGQDLQLVMGLTGDDDIAYYDIGGLPSTAVSFIKFESHSTFSYGGQPGQVLYMQDWAPEPPKAVWSDPPSPLYMQIKAAGSETMTVPGYPAMWDNFYSANGSSTQNITMFNNGRFAFRCAKAGTYRLDYSTEFEFTSTVTTRQVKITVFKQKLDDDGNPYDIVEVAQAKQGGSGVSWWQISLFSIVQLALDDYISIYYEEANGGSILIFSNTKLLMTMV